jgi:hypothetical protein
VVQTQIECVYSFHGAIRDEASQDTTKALGHPIFFPSEWLIELGDAFTLPWGTQDGVSKLVPAQSVRAYRPVVVEARTEAHALLQAAEINQNDYVSSLDTFSLNGWHKRDPKHCALSARRLDPSRKIKTTFEVDTTKIVAPDIAASHLEVDQQFELLRWMWQTGKDYEAPAPYRPWSVQRLLRGDTTDWTRTNPFITSRADLQTLISRGILGRGHEIYDMWREDHGLSYGEKTSVKARHYGKSSSSITTYHAGLHVDQALWTAMRDIRGEHLAVSPNHVHPKAVVIRDFGVSVSEKGFTFVISYGFEESEYSSSWAHTLATTRGDETFYETAERALALLHRIVPNYRLGHRSLPRAA